MSDDVDTVDRLIRARLPDDIKSVTARKCYATSIAIGMWVDVDGDRDWIRLVDVVVAPGRRRWSVHHERYHHDEPDVRGPWNNVAPGRGWRERMADEAAAAVTERARMEVGR